MIRVTEDRLLKCLPPKEKNKYLSINHKATLQEIQEAESEMLKWQSDVKEIDKTMTSNNKDNVNSSAKKNIPAVRGSKSNVGVKTPSDSDIIPLRILKDSPHLSSLSKTQLNKLIQMKNHLEVSKLSDERKKYKASKYN